MKNKFMTRFIVVILIGLAFSIGWLKGTHHHERDVPVISQTDHPEHSHEPAPGEEKVQYTCGMHPWIIVDEPGICPICQMDLTPLRKDNPQGKENQSGISIDPITRQNMGIRTAQVEYRTLSREIRTSGLIDYEEPRQFAVNTKIDGWIEKLYINETGIQVTKGQRLLDIYSPELVAAQEEYLLALKNFRQLQNSPYEEIKEGAGRLLEASEKRLQLWDISARQLSQLKTTGKVRRSLTLYAPYAGIVTTKQATEGAFIKSGSLLFTIADLSKIWVFADIYESELPLVNQGQHADIILPFLGDKQISGTVSTIYPYVDSQTRTVKARIDLDNRNLDLRPDMYVNVRLKSEPQAEILAIPAEAVINSGEKQTVFVLTMEGRFEPRLVKTGLLSDDGYLQIKDGVKAQDVVVTSAQFLLDSESQLQEAIQKMLEPSATANDSTTENQEELEDLF